MKLSDSILKSFVSSVTEQGKKSDGKTVYGTVVKDQNSTMLRIDGSEETTPVIQTIAVNNGDRVIAMVKDHSVTITGNLTDVAATNSEIDAVGTSAANALIAANGKNKSIYQSSQPTITQYPDLSAGDNWFDTDDGYHMYHWDGTAWQDDQLGTNALADACITNAKIGSLDAGKITTGTLSAILIYKDTNNYWNLGSSAVTISGTSIPAGKFKTNSGEFTGGIIGGWTITDSQIKGGTSSTGIAAMQVPSANITYVFAAGGTNANSYADYPFRVSKNGALVATKATIEGTIKTDKVYVYDHTLQGYYQVASSDNGILTLSSNSSQTKIAGAVGVGGITTISGIDYYGDGYIGSTRYPFTKVYVNAIEGGREQTINLITTNLEVGEQTHLVCGINGKLFRPISDNTHNLGTDACRWNNIYGYDIYYTNTLHSSDAKLKDVISNIEFAKKFIMSLKPTEYMWKAGNHKRTHLGFLAQDVYNVCRNINKDLSLVSARYKDSCNDDGICEKYYGEDVDDSLLNWSLSYDEFIAPLVKVIQEQEQRINNLESILERNNR